MVGMLLFLVAAGVGAVSQPPDWDYWGGLVIAPVLVILTVPLLKRTARRGDPWMARLLAYGLVLKLGGAFLRYEVGVTLYGGVADATLYVSKGTEIGRQLRAGDFNVDVGMKLVGTGFARLLTGIVFAVIGRTDLGGFMVFSWACFWGLYLFHRAFRLSIPDEQLQRRYGRLLFLLPSLLYWPSSVGKDAWMILMLGLAAHGAARMLSVRRGWLEMALGIVGALMVRPHVAGLALIAVFAAYLVGRSPRGARAAVLGKVIGVGVLLVGGLVVLSQAKKFLGLEQTDSASLSKSFGATAAASSEGGSKFTPIGSSPPKLPLAIVTVLFRPFPFEATGNVQQLASSFEGLFLMALFATNRRRIACSIRRVRHAPFLMAAIVYSVLFCFIFANIGNFGILTRERNQLFPFAFVLVCAPTPAPKARKG